MNQGNSINRTNYPNDYCLYAFDLIPDLSANTHFNFVRHGAVRIEIGFMETLIDTLDYIIYAEYDNVMEIYHSRHVTIDTSS